jgi:ArsR family transcriptional regulator
VPIIAEIEPPDTVLCCAPLVGPDLSTQEAATTAELFKALSDPTRVRIVNLLGSSPDAVCVCDINAHFELSQPTISHHLKKLVTAGVLRREQRGTWAYFSLNRDALKQLSAVFDTQKGQ